MSDPQEPLLQHNLPIIQGSMLDEQRVITDLLNAGVATPQLLLWQYDKPAVIMGCSQRPDDGQLQRAERAGLAMMRRGSGGGAVLAGPWMLSVTLFIPPEHPVGSLDLIQLFGWFEQIWTRALIDCGVSCKGVDKALIERSKQISKDAGVQWACYASLSHGEVVSLDGRKLVGLAQIRKRKGIALVSGLHIKSCDWRALCDVVVDDISQAPVLESLNSDAEQLSGIAAIKLLPEVIRRLTEELPQDVEVLKPAQGLS
ncbi:MAG: hypothetical protein V7707_11310 [Motiliproteus sp.]